MGNPVTFFEIVGPDAPTLQTFYADVFRWWQGRAVVTGGARCAAIRPVQEPGGQLHGVGEWIAGRRGI